MSRHFTPRPVSRYLDRTLSAKTYMVFGQPPGFEEFAFLRARAGVSTGLVGPVLVLLVVIVSGGLGYYQFAYLPSTVKTVVCPPLVCNPPQNVTVTVVPGAVNPNNGRFYVNETITVVLGVNNTVIWVNTDPGVLHTVTSDGGYGAFDKAAGPANYIEPGATWKYTFIAPGTYRYHCQPHPWMKGTVIAKQG